jgi:hypothetical protein
LRDAGESRDQSPGVGSGKRHRAEDDIGREGGELLAVPPQLAKVADDFDRCRWQRGRGPAAMEDRDVVALLDKPADDVRTGESGTAENEHAHLQACAAGTSSIVKKRIVVAISSGVL